MKTVLCTQIRTFVSFILLVFERKKKEKQNFKTENIQL